MEIIVSNKLCSAVPGFSAAVIQYKGVQVGPSPQMLKGRLQLFQESLYFDLEDSKVTELEGIKEWRAVFKQAGRDPNRFRHSAEALYRRVQKQNYLQSIHSAVDLNNFFSLKYQLPIGAYDQDKLSGGHVELRLGHDGEAYEGINGRENSLNSLIVSADKSGPFGSPFVDSVKTVVTTETTNVLQILYLRPSLDTAEKIKLTESLMEMFLQIHGGEGSYTLAGCE
ncbi:B3/4 domain-containing protein [Mesobacillus zeae]|uniref:B3/B4 tRNA-binding domain-containing protein n=1 Tax=Mesobacillus zeae TaxID=1917180 RepID=A0A398B0S3_9BACI|nr:phenylalanine--tRNA ligase beta subunit-related protein [Mesobacillus zeae]RID81483.1 hypothetical protein D1970_21730 [Mesobacillus zeae]